MNKKKICNTVRNIIIVFAFFVATFLLLTTQWIFDTWRSLSVDEIIYHVKMPIEGTSKDTIKSYIFPFGILIVIITIVFVFNLFLTKSKNVLKNIEKLTIIYLILSLIIVFINMNSRLNLIGYIKNTLDESSFIEENYVLPENDNLVFPEKKRNLIYIYLESMETTYSDKKNGGAFDHNLISDLTKLAQENVDFSGEDKELNGGFTLPGTTWTMGAIFGQSSGLPLNTEVDANNLDTQDSFYPNIVTIGDILKAEGYNNEILLGSDARFGGRKLFFDKHGDYSILDYNYSIENGLIPSDYYEFWGYEDEKLFEFARNELSKLSSENAPFNVTLLTVDTHFEDGYTCRLCKNEFENNQYANVISCSNKQVCDFVEWIKQQDFYDNTTIVISGDHLTMDSDFCENVDNSYERKVYTCYINPDCKESNPDNKRIYSVFDNFPTTLAALGVKIKNDRLGLGTNLFSEEKTILEQYGIDYCEEQLNKKSVYLSSVNTLSITDSFIDRLRIEGKINANYYDDHIKISYDLSSFGTNMVDLIDFNHFKALVWADNCEEIKEYELYPDANENNLFNTDIKLSELGKQINIDIYLFDKDSNAYFIGKEYSIAASTNFADFLNDLDDSNYTIFISAKDDASNALTNEHMKLLHKLGLKEKLNEASRQSYYAVISKDKILEKLSKKDLKYTHKYEDNEIKYSIESAGFDVGNKSSIIINNNEYSMDLRGLNFVIYDNASEKVIMSCNFDTFEGLGLSVMDLNVNSEREMFMENYYVNTEE